MDSDEEETFICIGNPVEQVDEDAPLKKPVSVQDLTVKDKRGRQRFHGAFTGGFSAGYFNSVGSKDGFAPSEFVSSRDEKKRESFRQTPEDFMDDEDFDEHGIAPRKLVTSDKFSTEERRKRRHDEGQALMTGTVFEGTTALTDFILPEKLTIGIRLLKKLGWKQGHGIGSRKKPDRKESGQKIYGCSLPSQTAEEESDEELQFGPKDVNPISFVAKDNVHGLGYSGLDPRSALPGSHINLFEPPAITKTGRKGIRGQAFGVGALEDADDDIYKTDHMSNYDMTIEIEDSSNLHGWTAPRSKHESKHLPIGYIGKVLEGFKLSDKPLNQRKHFPPPDLPRHYKPVHVFQKPTDCDVITKQKEQTAVTRGLALGEVESVFDLVPSRDKEKMLRIRKEGTPSTVPPITEQPLATDNSTQQSYKHPPGPTPPEQQLVPVQLDSTRQSHDISVGPTTQRTDTPVFSGGSFSFKPFAKNDRKQARYEKYLSVIKQGNKDAYEEVTEGHMTEWEKEREKEEFIRAAKMYKPLAGMIASRFTRAKFEDSVETVDVPREEGGDKDDRSKAADMKMYGKLTRDEFEWHPDRLLCRRFNVPDPYPGSGIVGLPSVRKDKYSVFNFLTFSSNETGASESSGQIEDDDHSSHQSITNKPAISSSAEHEKQSESSRSHEKQSESSRSHEKQSESSKSHEKQSESSRSHEKQSESSRSHDKSSKSHHHTSSIFSHLVQPDKHKQSTSSTRSKEKECQEKPISIFSHLVEDNSSKEVMKDKTPAVDEDKETQIVKTIEETSEGKPPVDLFAAIFGNTDSEDSDEEEEADNQSHDMETTNPSVPTTQDSRETTKESQYLPGASVVMETIEERLSPKIPEESLSYGPMPPTSHGLSSSVTSSLISSKDYLDHTGQGRHGSIDTSSLHLYTEKIIGQSDDNTHRKHKHSKHKNKKEKKSKHKKSKNKKKEKKKKKRYSDSEDDSSSEEEEDNIPTDKELIQKLKSLPKGKYMF